MQLNSKYKNTNNKIIMIMIKLIKNWIWKMLVLKEIIK